MAVQTLNNYPIRPMSKGMFRNLPPNGIPVGGFLRTQNFRVLPAGLERRHGLVNFDTNSNGDLDSPIVDIINFYRRSLENVTLYLTETGLFRKQGLNLTPVVLDTSAITITTSTAGTESTITFTSDVTMAELLRNKDILHTTAGDFAIQYFSYSNVGDIYTFTGAVYSAAPLVENALVGAATVTHKFVSSASMTVSWALLPVEGSGNEDSIIFADQSGRGLYIYRADGTFELYQVDSAVGGATTEVYTNILSMNTLVYFDGRLWAGNTIEVDGEHKQRIRWSDVSTFDRFQFENYVDLPYTEGQLLALVPLGSLLVAYFADAVYFGRATNLASLPYEFTRMETGLVGPICDKAITKWVDTHFFVGHDDIYTMNESTGLTAIGAPIIDESLAFSNNLNTDLIKKTKIVHDINTESIAFLIPDYYDSAKEDFYGSERIWRFFYKTGAWSYDEVHFIDDDKTRPSFLYTGLAASHVYLYGRSWEEWQAIDPVGADVDSDLAQWWREDTSIAEEGNAFSDYPTWDALINEDIRPLTMKVSVWKSVEDQLLVVEESKGEPTDTILDSTYPIWAIIESPDYDLNVPDVTKTFTRLSIKSFQNRVDRYTGSLEQFDQVDFSLQHSIDSGYSFTRAQTLRWRPRYNEGKADFRASGSTYRFKVISSAEIPAYKLSEIVLRFVGRGLQIEY